MSLVLIQDNTGRDDATSRPLPRPFARALATIGSVVATSVLTGVSLYAIGFTGTFPVPKTVDSASGGWPATVALSIDIELLGICALLYFGATRHLLARALERVVERDTVRHGVRLLSGLAAALLFAAWQPLPEILWRADDLRIAGLLQAVSLAGWLAVAHAAILSRAFEPVRARYLSMGLVGRTGDAEMIAPRLYRLLRYPLYLGPMLALWSTPVMTAGRLLLAGGATLHAALCIWWEEWRPPSRFGGLSSPAR